MRVALKTLKAPSFWMLSLALIFALFIVRDLTLKESVIEGMEFSKGNRTINISRKLLQSSDENDTNRVGTDCSKNDVEIHQEQVSPLPSGIPVYMVEIMNMCASDCSISNIHLHCGWFSSASLVNPKVFKRLDFDDCLVYDGHPIGPGRSLFFEYANTYRYPLNVSSLVCLHP